MDKPLPPPEVVTDRQSIASWEWLAIGGIVVVSAWRYLGIARSIWFHSDYWGILLEHELSIPSLFVPHAGHLAIFHVAATEITSWIAGDSAWKLLIGIRTVTWAFLVVASWYIARRRGAASVIALAYAATLTMFALSAWVRGWLIGNPIAIVAIITAAYLMERRGDITTRDRAIVGGLGGIAVVSTGVGVVGLIALLVTSLVIPKLRAYASPLAVAAALYASWYVLVRGSSGGPGIQVSAVTTIPWNLSQILADGFATFTGTSFLVGAILVVVVICLLVWSFLARMPSPFDLVLALWAVGFTALVSITRIAAGQAQVQANRYEYVVILALLAVAIPRIPSLPTKRAFAAIATVGVLVSAMYLVRVNDAELRVGIDFWTRWSNTSEEIVTAAGKLIDDGEPFLPSAPVDDRRTGMLTAAGVARLVESNWFTQNEIHSAESLVAARGDLRLLVRNLNGDAPDTCQVITRQATVELEPSRFVVDVEANSEVLLRYSDSYGVGEKTVRSDVVVTPLQADGATIAVTLESGAATVCVSQP